MTQQDLETLFSPYGRIITSRILCDNITGKNQNYPYQSNIMAEAELLGNIFYQF